MKHFKDDSLCTKVIEQQMDKSSGNSIEAVLKKTKKKESSRWITGISIG